jgi:hypothetical protein
VSRMQKTAAEKRIAALKSQHGEKWMEMGARFLHELPGGERVPFDELQRRAGYVADPNAPPIQASPLSDAIDTPEKLHIRAFARGLGKPVEQLTAQELQQARREFMTSDDRPLAGASGGGQSAPRPMTDGQRANVIGSRRSQWTRFTKAILDRQQSVAKVDSGLAALSRGNRNAATQIIITAFNKLQDEASVVREGEYARSEQLAPLTSRIEGAILRLTQGGGALNDAQLTALANEAKALSQALEKVSNDAAMNLRQGIEEELSDYGIPASRVFGGSIIGARNTGAGGGSGTGGGGRIYYDSTGKPVQKP